MVGKPHAQRLDSPCTIAQLWHRPSCDFDPREKVAVCAGDGLESPGLGLEGPWWFQSRQGLESPLPKINGSCVQRGVRLDSPRSVKKTVGLENPISKKKNSFFVFF